MTTRIRWIVLGVVLLLVLGLAALYWFKVIVDTAEMSEVDGRRTWIIQSGDEVTLSADEVRPEDQFRCEGMGALVAGTPGRDRMVARAGTRSGVITVETGPDGDVTVRCEPDVALP